MSTSVKEMAADVANTRLEQYVAPASFLARLTNEAIADVVTISRRQDGKADASFRLMKREDAESDNQKKKPNYAYYTPVLAVRYSDLHGIGRRNPDYPEFNTAQRKRTVTAMTYLPPKVLKKVQEITGRDVKKEQRFFIQQTQKLLDKMYRDLWAVDYVQKKTGLRKKAITDAVRTINNNPKLLEEMGVEMATADMPQVQEYALFECFLREKNFQTFLKPDPDHEGEWIVVMKTPAFRWTKDKESPKEYPLVMMENFYKEKMGEDLMEIEESERDAAFAKFVYNYFLTEKDTHYEFQPIRYTSNFDQEIKVPSFLEKVVWSGCVCRFKVNPGLHSSETAFGARLTLKNHVDIVYARKYKPQLEEADRYYQCETLSWEKMKQMRDGVGSDSDSDDDEEESSVNGFKRKRLEMAKEGDLNEMGACAEEENGELREGPADNDEEDYTGSDIQPSKRMRVEV
jgi:hypothetical protein